VDGLKYVLISFISGLILEWGKGMKNSFHDKSVYMTKGDLLSHKRKGEMKKTFSKTWIGGSIGSGWGCVGLVASLCGCRGWRGKSGRRSCLEWSGPSIWGRRFGVVSTHAGVVAGTNGPVR
jgi:hypothetical protein